MPEFRYAKYLKAQSLAVNVCQYQEGCIETSYKLAPDVELPLQMRDFYNEP